MADNMSTEQLEFNLGEDEEPATVSFGKDADGNQEPGQLEVEPPQPTQREAQSHSDELGSVNEAVQKRIARVSRVNGSEKIYMRNGSTYGIVTPNDKGARGLSLNLMVIDELATTGFNPTLSSFHSNTMFTIIFLFTDINSVITT